MLGRKRQGAMDSPDADTIVHRERPQSPVRRLVQREHGLSIVLGSVRRLVCDGSTVRMPDWYSHRREPEPLPGHHEPAEGNIAGPNVDEEEFRIRLQLLPDLRLEN